MFLECSLFSHSPKLETPQVSIKVERISYLWYIHAVEVHMVMRRNDLQLNAIPWLNLTIDCWAKEGGHQRELTVWFKGQNRAKPSHSSRRQDSGWPGHSTVTRRACGRSSRATCFWIWVCSICEDSLNCTLDLYTFSVYVIQRCAGKPAFQEK